MKQPVFRTRLFSPLFLMILMTASWSGHAQQTSPIGKTDIHALLEQAPGLPATTEEAGRRSYGPNLLQPDYQSLDRYYQPYLDRVEAAQKQFQQVYGGKMEAFAASGGVGAAYQQTMAQVNTNPIIQGMGGYEKVSQMDEKQAEAAARKAAAAYAADPFAANGVQSAGMTELYRKVVSDPAYAARFQKMSDKEKEAELRKYMAGDAVQAKTPQQMEQEHQRFEHQMQQKNKVADAMAITRELSEIRMQVESARIAFEEEIAGLGALPGNHDEIHLRYEKIHAAIPEISMGEAGRHKDPVQVKKANAEAAAQHRMAAASNLKRFQALLAGLKTQYKTAVSRYQDFIKPYLGNLNGSMADYYSGTNTEFTVAEFEMQLIGLAGDLALASKKLTEETAQWEAAYVKEK